MTPRLENLSPLLLAATFAGVGIGAGWLLALWIRRLTPRGRPLAAERRMTACCVVVTALMFAAFAVAYLHFGCQAVPEVQPSALWRGGRLFYHLVLIGLLIAATGTDLRDYVIPDPITLAGLLVGIGGATVAGELQMIHLWVDWNAEIPGLKGPDIPAWLDAHRHLHGLAWSTAGAATGAGITWCVRLVASQLLGQEAMGFGDVTLMGMIGSFIGWQPVLIAFLLAPLCGLLVGLTVRFTSPRTILPYGPYLAAGTLIVLFGWRAIWMLELETARGSTFALRRLFGDWIGLLAVGGIALTALVVLLGLLRVYRGMTGQGGGKAL